MGILSALARSAVRARGRHLVGQMDRAEERLVRANDVLDGVEASLRSSDSFRSRMAGAYLRDDADRAADRAYREHQTFQRKLRGNDRLMNRMD